MQLHGGTGAVRKVGITGEKVMFTSNETPIAEYVKAKELGAVLNLDDITHIEFIDSQIGLPKTICFRYNPGPLRDGNEIIGKPEEAKYGLTREQLFEAYRIMKDKGATKFGIHTMIVSNELNRDYLAETAKMMFELVAEISKEVGIQFSFVNFGGGIGIPYKPEQEPVDLEALGQTIKQLYEEIIVANGLAPLKICLECGRMVTGPLWISGDKGYPHQGHLQALYRRRRVHGQSDAARHVRRLSSLHCAGQRKRTGRPCVRCGRQPVRKLR